MASRPTPQSQCTTFGRQSTTLFLIPPPPELQNITVKFNSLNHIPASTISQNNSGCQLPASCPQRRRRLNSGLLVGTWASPIITKSITCAVIYTAADLSSQTIVRKSSESHDLVRTLRMAGYGMLILGPSLHCWFNFVSRILPKHDLITTLKKIVLGQTLYGPTMTVVFFSVNAALQGESGPEIVARLKRDLVPTMISGVMYWPICDFVTFKFIPVHLQPLVSNGFAYLWNVYLTYMASREKVHAA